MHDLIHTLQHALMITGFVFVMMLLVEYLNVITSGRWQEKLTHYQWSQYLLAALLGATPGCLGSFMMVTLYSHRAVSIGALVTTMIATSGDEAFVLFAMMPQKALLITLFLAGVGIIAGLLTDFILKRRRNEHQMVCQGMQIHEINHCDCFPSGEIVSMWKNCTLARAVLTLLLVLFIAGTVTGVIGESDSGWDWIRVTILVSISLALFIVITVPDHFLEEHLWEHIAKKHAPRIFLWTLGALLAVHFLIDALNLEPVMKEGKWFVLVISGLVGIIPESGPHLIFVTMYARGVIPMSVLLTSSIVQDGHGMLPLLACSRKDFILVKGINFAAGLLVGSVFMLLGN